MRQGKAWGETTEFFRNSTVSAHHISVKKGGYCSEHRHEHKHNVFYVISGKLLVTIWRDTMLLDTTVVSTGQLSAVPPGFYHKFEALEDTECIEIYQVVLSDPDIERRSQGGLTG